MKRSFFLLVLSLLLSLGSVGPSFAQSCPEYFADEWGTALEMNTEGDVLFNIIPYEAHDISSHSYSGGVFSASTNGPDPWIRFLNQGIATLDLNTTRYGPLKPIDPAKYKILQIRLFSPVASFFQIFWDKANGGNAISNPIATSVGWAEYSIDLSTTTGYFPGSGQPLPSVAWSNGNNTGLRLDPIAPGNSASSFQLDWVRLTSSNCTPSTRVAPFIQPDIEGGDDYFVKVRSNPNNMDSAEDIDLMGSTSSSIIHNGELYQDSAGITRLSDYLEARNIQGNPDPVNASLFNEKAKPIDAARYRIACWTLDVLAPVDIYHSVTRVYWMQDGNYITGDDIINKTTGENRYCLRLDSLQLETALPAGQPHPWRNNSDGSGIPIFRIDPHEETNATTYRFNDLRIASDHYADQQFAVVLGGSRDAQVQVFANSSATGDVAVGTLNSGRNTDVILWNTSALPHARYSLYSVIEGRRHNADGSVIVERGSDFATDGQAPLLKVYSPGDGHRFENSLKVNGYALDNRRVAIVEVLIDDVLKDAFKPSLYDKEAHDLYFTSPFCSEAGFQRTIDTSALSDGSHRLTVKVFDTAGNLTIITRDILKAHSALSADYSYPNQAGPQINVPLGARPKDPGPSPTSGPPPAATGKVSKFSVSVRNDSIGVNVTSRSCANVRVLANTVGASKEQLLKGASLLTTVTKKPGTVKGSFKSLPKFVQKNRKSAFKIYLYADCGDGTAGIIRSFDARKIRSSKRINSLPKLVGKMRKFSRI